MRQETMAALIVDDDILASTRLRRSLEELGYAVREADETEAALALLAEEACSYITFFRVELPRNRMSGTDHADLIGALLRDASLGERHAFIVVTESPASVEAVLGRLLERLSVPIVTKPSNLDALHEAITQAAAHLVTDVALAL